jgi:hypothetical protein
MDESINELTDFSGSFAKVNAEPNKMAEIKTYIKPMKRPVLSPIIYAITPV